MIRLILVVAIFSFITGCTFKSVMEGEADDIIKAAIYSFEGVERLVMIETVFQATSKESGRGLTRITGYNVIRISVYDLNSGSLIARKKTGEQISHPIVFLGCTSHNLWFYSSSDGIHSLDPETLRVRVSQDSVFVVNPELTGKLAKCDWYQLSRFFQFNEITGQIILTDNEGYRYSLDPVSLKAKKIEWEYRSFESRRDQCFVSSITIPQPSIQLAGDLRKQMKVEGKEVNPGLTYLDGQFIAERNPSRHLAGLDQALTGHMLKLEAIYPKVVKFRALNDGQGPRWEDPRRDTLRYLENIRSRMESEIRRLEQCRTELVATGSSSSYTKLLAPDSTTYFVFHRSGTQKDANVTISRVKMKNFNEISELWTTEIPGLFFDPSAARETNSFKIVFSKGDPEFDFKQFELIGNRLIIIWMLHVHCLDLTSGKILWKFRV